MNKKTHNQPVIGHTPSGEPHEFTLNGDRAWLTVGEYSLYIIKDLNYGGLRVESYRHGQAADLPNDALYGDVNSGQIPPNRLKHK